MEGCIDEFEDGHGVSSVYGRLTGPDSGGVWAEFRMRDGVQHRRAGPDEGRSDQE